MSTLVAINNYHYFRGGAETVFMRQNALLSAAGWRVVPFSMKHPQNIESDWSRYFIDEIEFGQAYSLTQKARMAAKVVYSMEARRKIGALIDAVRPDLCHAHNVYHHISPSIFSLLHKRGLPVVLTLHDLKVACPAYTMLSTDGICERCKGGRFHQVLVHRCIKGSMALSAIVMIESALHSLLATYRDNVSRFIVPSRFYADKLAEWGLPSERFRYVPNFVDSQPNISGVAAGRYFLYFGRLSREKGISTLIRATALAGVDLVVAGAGTELPLLKQLAIDTGANVTFAGHLSGDRLMRTIEGCRAVVLPSEWYENAPMSILEAYSFGKPVIGADIGGIPELVRVGETGYLFESGSAESLAAQLRFVTQAPDDALRAMGHAASEWIRTEFSSDRYLERLVAVYRELGVQ